MSFDTDEEGVETSQPIELYKVTGDDVAYYRTSNVIPVVYSGNTYTCVPISRSDVEVSGQGDQPEMVVTLPTSDQIVQDQAGDTPSNNLELTVYRQQGANTLEWYKGPITGFSFKGKTAQMRSPTYLDDPLLSYISSVFYQARICNHQLYNARCGVARASFDQPATLSTVTGRTIIVSTVGALEEVGEVLHANGERRMVLSQTGTTLILTHAFRNAVATDAVTLYEKCDRSIRECRDKFSNVVNWGGQPQLPKASPFTWNIFGATFN